MYNMDKGRLPSRPLIISQTQTDHALQSWLRENNVSTITDGSGMTWDVSVTVENQADPVNRHGGMTIVHVQVSASVGCDQLIACKSFDAKSDTRLLGLLSSQKVPISLLSERLIGSDIQKLRTEFAGLIVELRKKIGLMTPHELRRRSVCEFVDQAGIFKRP
jgi:hypothetical protein